MLHIGTFRGVKGSVKEGKEEKNKKRKREKERSKEKAGRGRLAFALCIPET